MESGLAARRLPAERLPARAARREDPLLAAFEEGLAHARRRIREASPEPGGACDWSTRIRLALTALLELFDRDRPLAHLLLVEPQRAGGRLRERQDRALRELVAVLESSGRDERASLPFSARGAVSAAAWVLQRRLLNRPEAPLVELAGALTALLVLRREDPEVAARELGRRRASEPGCGARRSNSGLHPAT
jgi:hypothetical protein